jgi:putative nucleotidyltransferase with HDIG domain
MIAGLLTYANMEQTVIRMGVSLVSGLLSGVLCLGTTPVWENIFKALTPMKLMELCNPTNALLKRLMFEAPGTYHHSVMVGNLAEAAAEAIGANGLLARVGAYYHDVGKLSAPMYFSENQQPGHNPHDALAPLESARIILRHPHDGAAYLREQGIAQPIIDIALEHHGDTPVGYFLNAAKERGESVDAREFCYTGGKPTSAEAAIVMLADCCEAATRACAPNGDYRAVMNKIVRKRMEDGQFDRVDMTFAELGTVVDTFESVLRGAYHSRVQYPDGAVAAVGEGDGR